jgi:hypothetical protein
MTLPLVLVHSPLVGPATWAAAAGALRERGHEVLVPDLTATLTDDRRTGLDRSTRSRIPRPVRR